MKPRIKFGGSTKWTCAGDVAGVRVNAVGAESPIDAYIRAITNRLSLSMLGDKLNESQGLVLVSMRMFVELRKKPWWREVLARHDVPRPTTVGKLESQSRGVTMNRAQAQRAGFLPGNGE